MAALACNVYDDSLLGGGGALTGGGHSSGGAGNTGGSVATGGTGAHAGANGGASPSGGTSSTGGAAGNGTAGDGPIAGSAGQSATGGASSTGGSGGTSGAGGEPPIPTVPEIIDDMEDGNRNIKITGTPQRRGAWYLSSDVKVGGTQTPDPADSPFMTEIVPSRVEGSAKAFFTTAKGHSWALVGFDLNNGGKRAEYNASAYVGISFYARVEADSIKDLRVQILDKTTDPAGAVCDPDAKAPVDRQCHAHFGLDMSLTAEWKLYEIRFSQLYQPDWGQHADALDAAHLYGIQFTWTDPDPTKSPGMKLWIDDISFLIPAP